jgi:Asp-tRNA(Asn)/Glu-tRNA(Gln) amidotransferase A subunit family amidase
VTGARDLSGGLSADPAADPDNAFVERGHIAGAPDGPLAGLSFGVKDNVAVADMPFTAGHPLFADRRAVKTAPSVERLLAAGATFVGMTQTDAGGFGAITPQTRNPAAPGLIVGGSSGGSAAAVANGACDFAVGTDTGGSVRMPAACTGLVSFKPTYGRVSNDGVWPLTPQIDHVGLIARDLEILDRASRVLIDAAPDNTQVAAESLKIGVEIDRAGLFASDIADELDAIADALAAAGHTVTRIPVPGRENIAEAHGVIVLSEAAAIYADMDEDQRALLGKAAVSGLRHAEHLTEEAVEAAWEWTRAVANRMAGTLGSVDVLISPTLPIAPPAVAARRVDLGGEEVPVVVGMTLVTCLANLTGDPVVGFPNPLSGAAPQTGLQLTAGRGLDEMLLRMAARIEKNLSSAGTGR